MTENWVRACAKNDVDEEDLIRFDYKDNSFCIYHTTSGFFATDGYCTHERQHLEWGFVQDNVIECPLHQGRFDITSGKALGAPVCINLKTWPVKVDGDDVYVDLGELG